MSKSSTVDKMVAYMNEKYDDRFEYSAPFGGGPGSSSTQIVVRSEKYPDADIWVQYFKRDNKEIFTDNYVSYKYAEQTQALIMKLITDACGGKANISYEIGAKGTVNDFTDNTSFYEYISDIKAGIGFSACVLIDSSDLDVTLYENKLKTSIGSAGLVAFGTIYFTPDREIFDKIFSLPYKDLELLNQVHFDMDGSNSFSYFDWRLNYE